MAGKLQLSVYDIDTEVFKGECDIAIFPGVEGELGVMSGHTRLVTPLKSGQINIKNGIDEKKVDVEQGILFVEKDGARVLLR